MVQKLSDTVLNNHPNQTVIWIGNQDNLEGLYNFLGGEGKPPVENGDLYIMKIYDQGKPTVIRQRYGPQ